nr:MAG TPA: hypothetical protein [Caudoviricetes sp.]DAO72603.1 MAG TPA: hypothetical protein [Caudoviricetes sp.]
MPILIRLNTIKPRATTTVLAIINVAMLNLFYELFI